MDKGLMKKGQVAGLLGIAIALIIGVIILSIVTAVYNSTTYGTSSLTVTVLSYIGVGFAIGLLVLAFGVAMGKRED